MGQPTDPDTLVPDIVYLDRRGTGQATDKYVGTGCTPLRIQSMNLTGIAGKAGFGNPQV